jgi:uncharacterized protein YndB with AHSA1/START domain
MSETEPEKQAEDLVFEYELDAPPEKVWRAISTPGFRDKWLPREDLADADPVSTAPGGEIRYAMRDCEPEQSKSNANGRSDAAIVGV